MRQTKNFPGDSECTLGLVEGVDERTHVCQDCLGNGCPSKRVSYRVLARHRLKLLELSGSTVLSDQKGRMVFVDLDKRTAFVME